MPHFELEAGEVIQQSLGKVLLGLLASGFFFVVGSGLLLCCIGAAIFADRNFGPAHYLMIGLGSISGALFGTYGGIGTAVYVWRLMRRARWVLGQRFLQRVVGQSEIVAQLPWENISEIQLITEPLEDNETMTFVGIRVYNPRRSDTRLPHSVSHPSDSYEFDCYVEDLYVVSPEEICERLRERHASFYRPSGILGDLPPVADDPIPLWEAGESGPIPQPRRPASNPPKAGPPRRKRRRKNRASSFSLLSRESPYRLWILAGAIAVAVFGLVSCLGIVWLLVAYRT